MENSPFKDLHKNRGKIQLDQEVHTHEQAADKFIGKFLCKGEETLGVVTGVTTTPRLGMQPGVYLIISNFNKPSEYIKVG